MAEQLMVEFEAGEMPKALQALKRAVGKRQIAGDLPMPNGVSGGEFIGWSRHVPLRDRRIRHVWQYDMRPLSRTFDKIVHRLDILVE